MPRPTPHLHHHRLGRPQDVRVRELRGGLVVPEPRRTRSLVERPTISPLASTPLRSHRSASPAARPSSPRQEADWSREARITRSPAGRISVRPEPRTVGSHPPSPSCFTASPSSSSPYRHHLSPSPLRSSVSPAAAATASSHRLPPLEFPEDLVSPRGAGGQGRVPRREAWERQRQGKPLRHSPLSFSPSFSPSPAAQPDSGAQARFMAVLCREIEELKHKIEVLEESGGDRPLSPPRHSPTTFAPTATGKRMICLFPVRNLFSIF